MSTADTAQTHIVYRVYGARRRLLYIGCTRNLRQRKVDHRSYALWWHLAKTWTFDGPHDYQTARRIEIEAIHAERPKFNLTGRVPNYSPRRSRTPQEAT
jgi:hypothetical protein